MLNVLLVKVLKVGFLEDSRSKISLLVDDHTSVKVSRIPLPPPVLQSCSKEIHSL